jgi:hypothetical protein
MLISNPLKNFFKNAQKRYEQNKFDEHEKKWKSAYFCHVFANNFFWYIFITFSTVLNQREILRFLIPTLNFEKNNFFCS